MADAKDKGAKAPKDGAPKGGGKPEPKVKAKGRPQQSEVAAAGKVKGAPKDYVARLRDHYEKEIIPVVLHAFVYVANVRAKSAARVVPVLLELGKYPARKSSCAFPKIVAPT